MDTTGKEQRERGRAEIEQTIMDARLRMHEIGNEAHYRTILVSEGTYNRRLDRTSHHDMSRVGVEEQIMQAREREVWRGITETWRRENVYPRDLADAREKLANRDVGRE
jgi:hypothetical protein